ncbi:MAG: hypothetical protein JXA95_13630 [Spirochaetales bacterium]|nr:hypothetical protein [Spirochaetales bacterium]
MVFYGLDAVLSEGDERVGAGVETQSEPNRMGKESRLLGQKAKLVINSFEISETSPTYTVELWEQDVSDPDDFIGSMNITFDKNEMEINYTLDIDPSLVSDFNREEEYLPQ